MIRTKKQEQELRDRMIARLGKYSFSQRKAIAEKSGFHFNTIHYWVMRKYQPTTENCVKMLKILDEVEGE